MQAISVRAMHSYVTVMLSNGVTYHHNTGMHIPSSSSHIKALAMACQYHVYTTYHILPLMLTILQIGEALACARLVDSFNHPLIAPNWPTVKINRTAAWLVMSSGHVLVLSCKT